MIKNIIFDLSEVIISGYHGIEKTVEQYTDIPAKEFSKRKKETRGIFFDTMRGKYSEEEYLEHLLSGTNWKITKEELKELIRKNMNIPVQGTLDILKKLKNKYHLILLSDHVREWMEYILANNQELEIFDHKCFSYEYGKLKSDEGSFQCVIENLQINPKETILIDDKKDNIDLANENGIDGIIFKNAKQLKIELEKRSVL